MPTIRSVLLVRGAAESGDGLVAGSSDVVTMLVTVVAPEGAG